MASLCLLLLAASTARADCHRRMMKANTAPAPAPDFAPAPAPAPAGEDAADAGLLAPEEDTSTDTLTSEQDDSPPEDQSPDQQTSDTSSDNGDLSIQSGGSLATQGPVPPAEGALPGCVPPRLICLCGSRSTAEADQHAVTMWFSCHPSHACSTIAPADPHQLVHTPLTTPACFSPPRAGFTPVRVPAADRGTCKLKPQQNMMCDSGMGTEDGTVPSDYQLLADPDQVERCGAIPMTSVVQSVSSPPSSPQLLLAACFYCAGTQPWAPLPLWAGSLEHCRVLVV
jgi:hypothetical protein